MIPYATRQGLTMQEEEQKIANEAYGRNATPVLHKDLSALGLVTANCSKRERSTMFAYRIIEQLRP